MTEPENQTLALLREIRADMKDIRAEMKAGFTAVAANVADQDIKIDKTRKELSEQIVGLRRAIVEYHSAVIGHGMIISDLEARLRKVEQHLNLTGGDAH